MENMDYIINWNEMSKSRGSEELRGLLRGGILSTLALASKPQSEPSLRLLYCHNVFDDQVNAFEDYIKYLTNIGSFLTSYEVLAIANGSKKLDKRYFHLSFDDGFRNIITNALPVLRRYGVSATFFVPTSIISANYQIVRNYCLNICRYPGVIEMATWDDLAKAQELGLTIASHTRTHARFSRISFSAARLEDEIYGSKADLEEKLGGPCRFISWPYGTIRDVNADSVDCVKRAGYEACFGAFRGRIEPGKTDSYHIPRHHFEPHWPLSHMRYFAHGGMEGGSRKGQGVYR